VLIRERREHAAPMRTQTAAHAVTAERLRIARDLHDMVAHSIGIIAIQSGAARRVMETQPDKARDALAAIEAARWRRLS
jgi:signal transduction histidine kinase